MQAPRGMYDIAPVRPLAVPPPTAPPRHPEDDAVSLASSDADCGSSTATATTATTDMMLHTLLPGGSPASVCSAFSAYGGNNLLYDMADLSLYGSSPVYGTSPSAAMDAVMQAKSLLLHPNAAAGTRSTPASPLLPFGPISAAAPGHRLPAPAPAAAAAAPAAPPSPADPSLLHVSLATLLGCCEMLGHAMEDRAPVAAQQDAALLGPLQAASTVPLRDASQRPLFAVAPLDVLVTRDEQGRNRFHVIEINGTGIAGLTNMTEGAVQEVLRCFQDMPAQLLADADAAAAAGAEAVEPLVLVASSGQETYPPVSRTLHEKLLYVEALARGFAAAGRPAAVTNMARLEKRPDAMPPPGSGPVIVLGYMKQFRRNFMEQQQQQQQAGGCASACPCAGSSSSCCPSAISAPSPSPCASPPSSKLLLFGRQVTAAINDRFVLNTSYQFGHRLDLAPPHFRALNAGFVAGADKGVAYQLYNAFFGPHGPGARFGCMAPAIHYRRAHTRDQLVAAIQQWLGAGGQEGQQGEQQDEHGVYGELQMDGVPTAAAAAGGSLAPQGHGTAACGVPQAVVIKPQGTGCGHGIEFFFHDPTPCPRDTEAKVDHAIASVTANYNLQCGGMPFTVCEYLDTATIAPPALAAPPHTAGVGSCGGGAGGGGAGTCGASACGGSKAGHKFELRVVVYRAGDELRAFPSIAKVAREAFDPLHPDNKRSLLNNITPSAKETATQGSDHILPLCRPASLAALGIGAAELAQLCAACTAFVRFVVDAVQDSPGLFRPGAV